MKRKRLLVSLYYFLNIIFVLLVLFLGIFYYYGRDLPSELTLLDYLPPTATRIYSSNGNIIEEYATEHRVIIPFEEIPLIIKGAFIVAEDRDFYKHGGISFQGLIRSVIQNTVKNLWSEKPFGGSTITQQIAKNLLIGNAKNISRKIKEAIMAFRIEASIPKDKILEIYLNQLYLGKGCYGIGAACNRYFYKDIKNIKPEEAAFLAAIPSSPTAYSNSINSKKLLKKRNHILYQMYDLGYIGRQQLKQAINKTIKINKTNNKHLAPYFANEILRQVSKKVSKTAFFKCGYKITTTLDEYIQHCATKALEDGLISFRKTKPWVNIEYKTDDLKKISKDLPNTINKIIPCKISAINKEYLKAIDDNGNNIVVDLSKHFYTNVKFKINDIVLCRAMNNNEYYELYQQPEFTGGIIVMDASNGDILGMSGGYSFDISIFNCITQGIRQPGSIIKPFVYACAVESGMNEHDKILDSIVKIKLSNGTIYTPHNFSNKYLGEIELREGLIYSTNAATVNLARTIGMNKISTLLEKLNLIKRHISISAVLGAIDVTPINLLSAFSIFTNDGIMVYPRFIKNITQYNNQYAQQSLTKSLCLNKSKRVISKNTAQIIKNILHDVVHYGTARKLSPLEEKYGIEIIGKTGTTNGCKDTWFLGAFTKNNKTYLVCVFVGYPTPKPLGDNAYGASVALPIFQNFITNFFEFHNNKA